MSIRCDKVDDVTTVVKDVVFEYLTDYIFDFAQDLEPDKSSIPESTHLMVIDDFYDSVVELIYEHKTKDVKKKTFTCAKDAIEDLITESLEKIVKKIYPMLSGEEQDWGISDSTYEDLRLYILEEIKYQLKN